MGGQPSRMQLASAHEKAVVDRLHDLSMEDEEFDEKTLDGHALRNAEGLPINVLKSWQSDILSDPKNKLALTALRAANPRNVLTSGPILQADQQIFNIKIPFEGGPITNQRSSGRCWLFASTNVFRVALMKRYKLDSFELSQSYLFFWDKLEKSNWFLEQIIDTAGEDIEGRLVQALLGDIVSDGGQWDMVFNLVEKYGLVPQALYPDSWSAMNSGVLNSMVKTKLREFALKLRGMCKKQVSAAALSSAKAKMLREISLIMTLLLGPPPSPDAHFTWEYTDKDGQSHQLVTSPKTFAQNISSSEFRISSSTISSMISLVHDPRHEAMSLLTVSRLGNIVGGRSVSYVNVEMKTLKAVCIKMLKAGLPIFFGSDVGKFSDSVSGIMDLDLYDYSIGFNTSLLGMTKAERLTTGESQMTHAMVLTAVHVDEKTGSPVRWRVQNSWGTDRGDKGWFVASDAWFDEFVYQAVVDPKFCSKEVTDVLKQEPTVLPLWDPMGSLA
jgi:bleomycin hydrolase